MHGGTSCSKSTEVGVHALCRYRLAFQWEDGTMAYHQTVLTFVSYPMSCGVVDMSWAPEKVVHLLNSTDGYLTHALCEVDSPDSQGPARSQQRRAPGLRLSPASERWATGHFVTCPDKHVTHAFFACDVTSACWAESDVIFDDLKERWNVPSPSSCRANMTSLPPSFPCASGVQRVPYTLVCDHRADCQDGSDEDFCLFPPLRGTSALRCGTSREVRRQRPSVSISHVWKLICCPRRKARSVTPKNCVHQE